MRSVIITCGLFVLGLSTANAQPFYGYGGPPPPPPGAFYPHPPHPHWHCKVKFDWQGPRKVCRWGW